MKRADLKTMQEWPLERKIRVTQTRIIEWYLRFDGQVYISFSGGKDSTVLLDLARRIFPDIEAMFLDTGLEYPEIRDFVKTKENVAWVRPTMSFNKVIEKYGFPVVSKETSKVIYYARKNMGKDTIYNRQALGIAKDKKGNLSPYNLSEQWRKMLQAPFGISHVCCSKLKKEPADKFAKKSGKKPITAMMTEESRLRKTAWLLNGCNSFKSGRSMPMAFWTEQDILRYLKEFKIPYCDIYGDIVVKSGQSSLFKIEYETTKAKRTGCMFCMFGVHLEKEPNRFQQMRETHPKFYDYCINKLGCGEVLDYIGVKY